MGIHNGATSRRYRQIIERLERTIPSSGKHQEESWYVLSSGHKVLFERLKPHIGSATEWAARNAEQDECDVERIMFPEPQLMTDHPLPGNEGVKEFSNGAQTLLFLNEESNVSRTSEEDEPDDTYLNR